MRVGGGEVLRGLPNKISIFYENLPEFKIDFCLIIADFCRFFQHWEVSAPSLLAPTPMISVRNEVYRCIGAQAVSTLVEKWQHSILVVTRKNQGKKHLSSLSRNPVE